MYLQSLTLITALSLTLQNNATFWIVSLSKSSEVLNKIASGLIPRPVNSLTLCCVGFVFTSDAKAVDLETVYELKGLKGNKSNVAKREFLFNPSLYLYIDNLEFKKYFKNPTYPMLLGRSSDLAIISEIKEINLEMKNNVKLGKTILPFGTDGAFGIIQALPTHFSDSIPRKAIGTKPYLLMNQFFNYSGDCYFDSELDWGVWIHK